MAALRARGWTEHQFFALPGQEQHRILAWEAQRMHARRSALSEAVKESRRDGKVLPEVVMIQLMGRLLAYT